LVFYSSVITMMHGPTNIKLKKNGMCVIRITASGISNFQGWTLSWLCSTEKFHYSKYTVI